MQHTSLDGSTPLPRRSQPARGFHFTEYMTRLCVDMAGRLPQLAHIDMQQVAVCYRQARKAVSHGLQASLTPMRFEGGSLTAERSGRRWTVQRLYGIDGTEKLYILSFYLPRFLEHPLRFKLVTVLHELWHISPDFNGDLRRHEGRCHVHSSSQQQYDRHMELLLDEYLQADPPETLYDQLRLNFRQLLDRHGRVVGNKVPVPKLIPAE